MNILKKIDNWQNEGLINSQQASALKDYENKAKRPTLIYMLLFLSVFCIGVGIISLIASNWNTIPPAIKIFINFVVLAAVAFGIHKSDIHKKHFIKEALLILYAILILASIGLVGQIYHLKSNGYSAILFWSCMTLPLFYITGKPVLPFMWIPVSIYAFFAMIFDKFPKFSEYIKEVLLQNDTLMTGYYAGILALIGCLICSKNKERFLYVAKPLFSWAVISIVFQVILFEFRGLRYFFRIGNSYNVMSHNIILLAAVLFAGCAMAVYFYRKEPQVYIFYSIFIIMIFSVLQNSLYPISIFRALSTFSMLALLMVYAHKNNAARLFNFAGALVAVRIFIVYIQLFGSLLSTGIGLISTGLMLLLIIWIWHRIFIKKIFKEKNNEA